MNLKSMAVLFTSAVLMAACNSSMAQRGPVASIQFPKGDLNELTSQEKADGWKHWS